MKAVTVKRGSWHYRLWKFVQDPGVVFDRWDEPTPRQIENRSKEPKGFCGYFWTVVLGPPAVLIGGILVAAIGLVVGAFALVIWSIVRLGRLVKSLWTRKPRERTTLVATYVATKKARVCPRIELTD